MKSLTASDMNGTVKLFHIILATVTMYKQQVDEEREADVANKANFHQHWRDPLRTALIKAELISMIATCIVLLSQQTNLTILTKNVSSCFNLPQENCYKEFWCIMKS